MKKYLLLFCSLLFTACDGGSAKTSTEKSKATPAVTDRVKKERVQPDPQRVEEVRATVLWHADDEADLTGSLLSSPNEGIKKFKDLAAEWSKDEIPGVSGIVNKWWTLTVIHGPTIYTVQLSEEDGDTLNYEKIHFDEKDPKSKDTPLMHVRRFQLQLTNGKWQVKGKLYTQHPSQNLGDNKPLPAVFTNVVGESAMDRESAFKELNTAFQYMEEYAKYGKK